MIKFLSHAALAAALLAASSGAPAASTASAATGSAATVNSATVNYVNADRLTDVPRDRSERAFMESELLDHFNKLAARLPAGQALTIDIVDIDLAGEVFPRVPVRDVRVFKGMGDRPRIHLRYRIEEQGKVVRSGERALTDSAYLNGYNAYRSEIFAYEKQLLDDWFRKDFAPSP